MDWDPRKHPRDTRGRFAEVLNALEHGDTVHLPDGTSVHKTAITGMGGTMEVLTVHRDGKKIGEASGAGQALRVAQEAADKALTASAKHAHPEALGGNKAHKDLPSALKVNRARARREEKKGGIEAPPTRTGATVQGHVGSTRRATTPKTTGKQEREQFRRKLQNDRRQTGRDEARKREGGLQTLRDQQGNIVGYQVGGRRVNSVIRRNEQGDYTVELKSGEVLAGPFVTRGEAEAAPEHTGKRKTKRASELERDRLASEGVKLTPTSVSAERQRELDRQARGTGPLGDRLSSRPPIGPNAPKPAEELVKKQVTEEDALKVVFDDFSADTNDVARSLDISPKAAFKLLDSLEQKGIITGMEMHQSGAMSMLRGRGDQRARGETGKYIHLTWQSNMTYDDHTWEQVQANARQQGMSTKAVNTAVASKKPKKIKPPVSDATIKKLVNAYGMKAVSGNPDTILAKAQERQGTGRTMGEISNERAALQNAQALQRVHVNEGTDRLQRHITERMAELQPHIETIGAARVKGMSSRSELRDEVRRQESLTVHDDKAVRVKARKQAKAASTLSEQPFDLVQAAAGGSVRRDAGLDTQPYLPQGRTDQASYDYTDDPNQLAGKFTLSQLQDEIVYAESRGLNYGTMKFDYEESVPLAALKAAVLIAKQRR